jgi:hypothetical protein
VLFCVSWIPYCWVTRKQAWPCLFIPDDSIRTARIVWCDRVLFLHMFSQEWEVTRYSTNREKSHSFHWCHQIGEGRWRETVEISFKEVSQYSYGRSDWNHNRPRREPSACSVQVTVSYNLFPIIKISKTWTRDLKHAGWKFILYSCFTDRIPIIECSLPQCRRIFYLKFLICGFVAQKLLSVDGNAPNTSAERENNTVKF